MRSSVMIVIFEAYVSPVLLILEYWDYLRSEAKLTPGTIAGHKTAIVMTLTKCTDIDGCQDG